MPRNAVHKKIIILGVIALIMVGGFFSFEVDATSTQNPTTQTIGTTRSGLIIKRKQLTVQEAKTPEPVSQTPIRKDENDEIEVGKQETIITQSCADNEVLIKFADNTPQSIIDETYASIAGTEISVPSNAFKRVKVDLEKLREQRTPRDIQINERNPRSDSTALESLDSVLIKLQSSQYVVASECNFIATAFATVDDSFYKFQWNFPLIGVESAWDTTQGSGIVVAVVDTGVAYQNKSIYKQAPDLAHTNIANSYNAIWNTSDAFDDNGHGTHVAGTIAGSSNDTYGVAGIAYKSTIMPVKVLAANGSGTYADISEGIRWAADHHADIINLSLGGPQDSHIMKDAIEYAYNKGVLIIAAAGNGGTSSPMYPAAYDDYVISVGAVRFDKTKAPYSNYGTSLDIVAPGGDTQIDQNGDGYPDGILQQTLERSVYGVNTRNFNWYFFQGTSMAAPHVSAVAALIKSLGITNNQDIKQILFDSAQDLDKTGRDNTTGYGLVRADKAVELAQNFSSPQNSTTETASQQPVATNTATSEPIQNQEPEQPANEPPAEEPELSNMKLSVNPYNSWGRPDTSFAFWESAYLKVEVKDTNGNILPNVDLTIKIFDTADKLIARGGGNSGNNGELWLEMGKFSRGSYIIIVEGIKEGFNDAIEAANFRFR